MPQAVYGDWDAKAKGAAAASRMGRRASPPTAPRIPELAAEFTRRMKGELPRNFAQIAVDTAVAAHAKAETVAIAQGLAAGAGSLHRGTARDAGRLGRPDRLQPHQHQEHAAAALRPGGRRQAHRRRQDRPPHQLRRARVRHGGRHERHRAARRLHPLRRHLPHLQRLQPQRHPHGRADEAARDPRVHARLHRPGRRRPDAPVDRACGQPAPDPQPGRLASRRHRRDGGGLGRARCRT